jgi:hypothetical protein
MTTAASGFSPCAQATALAAARARSEALTISSNLAQAKIDGSSTDTTDVTQTSGVMLLFGDMHLRRHADAEAPRAAAGAHGDCMI